MLGNIIVGRGDDAFLGFESGGFQIFSDFLFDFRRDIFLEKGEGFSAIFGDTIMGSIGTGVHGDQFCFHQLRDCLLEVEIICIFPIQNKF